MTFGPTTSLYIIIILVISFFISIPLGITAIFLKPEEKRVNGNFIYSYDTKLSLGITAVPLCLIPLAFYFLGGTRLLHNNETIIYKSS